MYEMHKAQEASLASMNVNESSTTASMNINKSFNPRSRGLVGGVARQYEYK